MKVINGDGRDPFPPAASTVPYPYICHQTITGNTGLIYVLRVLPQPNSIPNPLGQGVAISLQYLSCAVALTKTSIDLEPNIVTFMLTHGEDMGKIGSNPASSVNQAAIKIAQDSRRGSGNILICHPDDSKYVFSSISNMIPIKVYTIRTPRIKGKLIINYKGSSDVDGGPILVTSGNLYDIAEAQITSKYVKVLEI